MTRNQRISSLVAVLLLTVGMSVALFAIGMRSIFLDYHGAIPKPFVTLHYPERGTAGRNGVMLGTALKLREQAEPELRAAVFVRPQSFNVVMPAINPADEVRQNLSGLWVDGDLFQLLRWKTAQGRNFNAADFSAGRTGDASVIISHAFWQRYLNSDPEVLGRKIRIDREIGEVIGVLPPQRAFPSNESIYLAHPFAKDTELMSRNVAVLTGVERKRIAALNTELESFSNKNPAAELPNGKVPKLQLMLRSELLLSPQTHLILTITGVLALCLLLLASINAGSLLLVQWLPRTAELATRAAIGSTPGRLMAVIVVHSALRVVLAALLALLTSEIWSHLFMDALRGAGEIFPAYADWNLNIPMLLWLTLAVFIAVLVVAAPMLWKLRESKLLGELRGSVRGNRSANRLGNVLLFFQTGLGVMVVLVALMAWRGVNVARTHDYGINSDGIVTATLRSTDKDAQELAARELQRALAADEDVQGFTISQSIPLVSWSSRDLVATDGEVNASYTEADPNFANVYGLKLKHGRWLQADDPRDTVVIDVAAAMKVFGKSKVVGKRLEYLDVNNTDVRFARIVGVVEDVTIDFELGPDLPSIFMPLNLKTQGSIHLSIQTKLSPDQLGTRLQSTVRGLDSAIAIFNVDTFENRFDGASVGFTILFAIFAPMGILASVLAGIGLAALLATLVLQRLRESAIRKSLGASRTQLLVPLLRALALSAFAGACASVAIFAPIAMRMDASLFGGETFGPLVVLGAMGGVFTCLCLAAIYPAYRALYIEPSVLLKQR
jgi:putative ABC transport system permease protein